MTTALNQCLRTRAGTPAVSMITAIGTSLQVEVFAERLRERAKAAKDAAAGLPVEFKAHPAYQDLKAAETPGDAQRIKRLNASAREALQEKDWDAEAKVKLGAALTQ